MRPNHVTFSVDPVPIKLLGEGDYALTDVQEFRVTEDFLGLDESIRGCKENKELERCEEKMFVEKVSSQCNCTPAELRSFFPYEVI